MSRTFFTCNIVVLGGSLLVYHVFTDRQTQKLYKNTRVFDLVMRTLNSHKGAVHFLGEPIKDGKLKIVDEKKDNDVTIYHVKVMVKGSKSPGCVNFWLRRLGEEPDAALTRMELQIKNIKNRLLIFQEDKAVEAPGQSPTT